MLDKIAEKTIQNLEERGEKAPLPTPQEMRELAQTIWDISYRFGWSKTRYKLERASDVLHIIANKIESHMNKSKDT